MPFLRVKKGTEPPLRTAQGHISRGAACYAIRMKIALFGLLAACTTARTAPPPLDKGELRARVRAEFQHAWNGYVRYAWGHDELRPKSRTPRLVKYPAAPCVAAAQLSISPGETA